MAKYKIILLGLSFVVTLFAQESTLPKANDFVYTMADGTQHSLYTLQSEIVLLYFYDPTCEDCHQLMVDLNTSEVINQLIDSKRLSVLAVYPEEDMEVWEPYIDAIPSVWINGYDKGAVINTEGLYYMTSLPALYLLDKEKNICLHTTDFKDIERELLRRK